MASVQIHDFGETEGVKKYRVFGELADLERIVEECREADAEFDESPDIVFVRKGQWTLLLKIKLPVQVEG